MNPTRQYVLLNDPEVEAVARWPGCTGEAKLAWQALKQMAVQFGRRRFKVSPSAIGEKQGTTDASGKRCLKRLEACSLIQIFVEKGALWDIYLEDAIEIQVARMSRADAENPQPNLPFDEGPPADHTEASASVPFAADGDRAPAPSSESSDGSAAHPPAEAGTEGRAGSAADAPRTMSLASASDIERGGSLSTSSSDIAGGASAALPARTSNIGGGASAALPARTSNIGGGASAALPAPAVSETPLERVRWLKAQQESAASPDADMDRQRLDEGALAEAISARRGASEEEAKQIVAMILRALRDPKLAAPSLERFVEAIASGQYAKRDLKRVLDELPAKVAATAASDLQKFGQQPPEKQRSSMFFGIMKNQFSDRGIPWQIRRFASNNNGAEKTEDDDGAIPH